MTQQWCRAELATITLPALERTRCSHIYEDKGLTGAHAMRPALLGCLRALRAGDTLIVSKLDRLGRNLRDLMRPWRESYGTRGWANDKRLFAEIRQLSYVEESRAAK
jgi:hypothetical protein